MSTSKIQGGVRVTGHDYSRIINCYLYSLNVLKCFCICSLGYGLVAKQVGKFSGCSIQSLWSTLL